MEKRSIRHTIVAGLIILLVVTGVVLAGCATLGSVIGTEVRAVTRQAEAVYGGQGTEALVKMIADEQRPLPERNRAVWAAGQWGDPRALPLLNTLYTGEECDHDAFLCQRELRKAVALCRGGPNVTAFLWRPGETTRNL